MEPFASMDPETRSYALVGYYLNGWGAMESALNELIAKALKLDFSQGLIVTRNLQFRSKQKILRTLVNEALLGNSERKAECDAFIVKLGDMSDDRNMVAHDWFGPCEKTGGVHFMVARASAKLKFPEVRWSILDVDRRHDELFNAMKTLKEMDGYFKHADMVKSLVAALMMHRDSSSPSGDNTQQAGEHPGGPQPPSDQDSGPPSSTPAKYAQTPEEPRG